MWYTFISIYIFYFKTYMSLVYLFVVLYSVITPANITVNINSILMLNGSNLKSCQENLLIVLAIMDFIFALRANSLVPLNSSHSQIAYVWWSRRRPFWKQSRAQYLKRWLWHWKMVCEERKGWNRYAFDNFNFNNVYEQRKENKER